VALVTSLGLAVLAGCAGLPDSGPAGSGRPIGETSVEPLQADPQGPRPGAGPAEVVGDFLHAGAGFADDHAVARSFLVGPAARSWRPARGTLVYQDDAVLTVRQLGGGEQVRVETQAPVAATIDASGRYTEARPGTTARATFTTERVGGQWRVSGLADDFGLWMPPYEVARAYAPVRINYLVPGSRMLVPDLRWFGGARAGLATALVRGLLDGPPAYLRDAVVSAAPPETGLSVDAVPSTDGVAQVDLTSAVLRGTPDQRRALWAELATTLGQLPGVSGVRITVAGRPFVVPGVTASSAGTDLGFTDDVRVAGEPLILTSGRLQRVDPGSGNAVPAAGTSVAGSASGAGLRSLSAGPRGTPLVGVDGAGTAVLRLTVEGRRDLVLTGTQLRDPVVDPRERIWTADGAVPGRLLVVDGSAAPGGASGSAAGAADRAGLVELTPAWLQGRSVEALDVSRDGARVAVVSSRGGERRLDVAGVVRNESGRPTRLSGTALAVARSLDDVRDVAWADRGTLVLLARSGNGPIRPYSASVGGTATALPDVDGAVSVAAGDGLRAVYVTTAAGQVLARSGSGWRFLGPGRGVTVPG
jgi:hypothetical protein